MMLNIYIQFLPFFKKRFFLNPERLHVFYWWVWGIPTFYFKNPSITPSTNLKYFSRLFRDYKNTSIISWVFWKFTRNNRPRINTYYPNYHFTFGLMKENLVLPHRNFSRSTFKLVLVLWNRVLLTPTMVWSFNYFSYIIFYIQRSINFLRNYQHLSFILPHHLTLSLKYKRARSIKKWVKKRFYPNIFF